MNFKQCYQQGPILAYVHPERCDCAFVFSGAAPAGDPSLKELVDKWNSAATGPDGRQQKALFLFPKMTGDVMTVARNFVQGALSDIQWNRLTYWSSQNPADGRIWFPTGEQYQFYNQQWLLGLKKNDVWQPVTDLANLSVECSEEKPQKLNIHGQGLEWVIASRGTLQTVASSPSLQMDFSDHDVVMGEELGLTGALGVPVLNDALHEVGFKLNYSQITRDGDQFTCDSLIEGHFADRLDSNIHAVLALDPRDNPNTTFLKRTQRSRLLFEPNLPLISHLITDKGQKVLLAVNGGSSRGFGRLYFEVSGGTIVDSDWSYYNGKISFTPHGDFEFRGVTGLPANKPGDKHRILTGGSATEFVDVVVGDVLRFHSGHPGVMRLGSESDADPPPNPADPTVDPAVKDLFNNGGGYVSTSWLTVVRQADFHTQPERSPVFETSRADNAPADDTPAAALERKSLAYGQVSAPIPFFPYAGVALRASTQDDGLADAEPTPDYEHLFLARARQLLVSRTQPSSDNLADDPLPKPKDMGVTPQGIISSYTGQDYKELRFGDPNGGTALTEFKLALSNPGGAGAEVYEAIQQALRGKDLFLVMHKLDTTAKAVISASPDLKVKEFTFHLGADLGESVLVLKYFKGKSLKDLLPDVSMWACKKHLASDLVWKAEQPDDKSNLRNLVYAKSPEGKEYMPSPLDKVWTDANWQGVLLLNLSLPKGSMPNLFEALKPGMVDDKLRLHHLGLNYLPVKDADLSSGTPRNGAAFGLMLYSPGKDKPKKPDSAEKHPEGSQGAPKTAYELEVKVLEVEFANSQVSRFKADVDASFSHVFWDETENGMHVIPLRGTYEARRKPNGETEDVFSLITTKPEEVKFKSSWLDKFVVSRAEFVVTSYDKAAKHIVSFLGFTGELLFKEPTDFKLFKVEKVMVEKLGLEFDYVTEPHSFKCRFRADSIRADVDFGDLGQSLLSVLGLKFKGFRVAIDQLLNFDRLGYVPLGWEGTGLDFHFGLDFELDMGFLGKLAGGKALKLPMLLGWKAGGPNLKNLGLGISFPNWNGSHFEIGIQSFISIRANKATLKPCKDGDNVTSFAIVLTKARLVMLGYEWPREADLDLALFVPVGHGRRMSWALARTDADSWLKYIAAGHRIALPAGKTTKEVVKNFKNILKNVKDDKKEADACSLLPYKADTNAWVVAGEFELAKLVQIWFAACDDPALYGLRVELLKTGFSADAMYRQLSPRVGVFSAEVSLPESLRTYQIGIATVRLPKLGLEIFTDGGFKVDLGYPWHNDFSRCFQLEIAIFLGSGGFWFSYTSGLGADWIALDESMDGYEPPTVVDGHHPLEDYQAISAGMAMRAGIGRSFELGILRGEASLTVFATLDGGIAFLKGDSGRKPVLYGIRGTMGVMLRIWVEVNFIILRATAEFCAYALVGFEIRRVLAIKDGNHYGLTLPVKVFAEVGIYVHVEVWVTIGCVKVKLFDLEFRGTWHWEETLGGYSASLLKGGANPHFLADDAAAVTRVVEWTADYRAFPGKETLEIFASLLPCVADPGDLPADATAQQPCVVAQLMLRAGPAAPGVMQGFEKLGRFMLGWVLQPGDTGTTRIMRAEITDARVQLDGDLLWLQLMDLLADEAHPCALVEQFSVSLTAVNLTMEADFAALPWWPGVRWHFNADQTGDPANPSDDIQPRKLKVDAQSRSGDLCMFVDYLRALTGSLLSEAERLIALTDDVAKKPVGLTWDELWQKLTAPN